MNGPDLDALYAAAEDEAVAPPKLKLSTGSMKRRFGTQPLPTSGMFTGRSPRARAGSRADPEPTMPRSTRDRGHRPPDDVAMGGLHADVLSARGQLAARRSETVPQHGDAAAEGWVLTARSPSKPIQAGLQDAARARELAVPTFDPAAVCRTTRGAGIHFLWWLPEDCRTCPSRSTKRTRCTNPPSQAASYLLQAQPGSAFNWAWRC